MGPAHHTFFTRNAGAAFPVAETHFQSLSERRTGVCQGRNCLGTCFRIVLGIPVGQRLCRAIIACLCMSLRRHHVSARRSGAMATKCVGTVPGTTRMLPDRERTLDMKSLLVLKRVQ